MSQVKAYKPEVAVLVGIQASLLLNHIKYWVEEYKLDKVYRTNQQISEDFKGTLSESQIQRAKKKLVDNGLVVISHDKGHLRTTHYSLTEKAKSLLGMLGDVVKSVVKKSVDAVKKPISSKPKRKDSGVKPTSMEKEFKNYGKNEGAVAIPEELKNKLKGLLKKKVVEEEVIAPTPIEEFEHKFDDFDDFDFASEDEDEDVVSDEDYFKALDKSFNECQKSKEIEKTFSLSDLVNKAFNTVPNLEQFEKNRKDLENARNFKEDY